MPAFNINNFRSHLDQRGTLLTNKFDVEFGIPVIMSRAEPLNYSNIKSTLNFRAEQIRLPGVSLDTFQVNRYGLGPAIKFPTSVNFTDISVTFIEDRDVKIWKFHNEWVSRIFDYTGNRGDGATGPYTLQYRKDYVIDIFINVYNNDPLTPIKSTAIPEPITTVVLKEAYPLSINDINLDWAQNNNLFKPTVTYTFKSWYVRNFVRDNVPENRKRFVDPGEDLNYRNDSSSIIPQSAAPTESSRPRPIILP